MKRIFVLLGIICFSSTMKGETVGVTQVVTKTVITSKDTLRLHFLRDSALYKEGWDTLAQARFWRNVISMTSDSCIINVASCRKPVEVVSRQIWMNQTESQKNFSRIVFVLSIALTVPRIYMSLPAKVNFTKSRRRLKISAKLSLFLKNRIVIPGMHRRFF